MSMGWQQSYQTKEEPKNEAVDPKNAEIAARSVIHNRQVRRVMPKKKKLR